MIEIYRQLIIQMVQEQHDELFLRQIYTILIRKMKKAGN